MRHLKASKDSLVKSETSLGAREGLVCSRGCHSTRSILDQNSLATSRLSKFRFEIAKEDFSAEI